jgi:hypothetical protein
MVRQTRLGKNGWEYPFLRISPGCPEPVLANELVASCRSLKKDSNLSAVFGFVRFVWCVVVGGRQNRCGKWNLRCAQLKNG